MSARFRSAAVAVLALPALLTGGLHAAAVPTGPSMPHLPAVGFTPGAAGAGDPYFPLDGNGGYDVGHYVLDLRYDPVKHRLAGTAAITATATQNLSRFNLDLVGLTVRAVTVDGAAATWTRTKHELVITPPAGIPDGSAFTARVRYDGVPAVIPDPSLGPSGVLRTPGGIAVMGEPHVAATWFPANDHPVDKAAYTFRITVPEGRKVVANGVLAATKTGGGQTTFRWEAAEPMAPYLATISAGRLDLASYTSGGLRYWDAVDATLLRRMKPRTGERFAVSGPAPRSTYRRLIRTVKVPADGARLSFWLDRSLSPSSSGHVFVEAHTKGRGDWTTLRDLRGHTTSRLDYCPALFAHPFLTHYVRSRADYSCAPRGSTGRWHAADGLSRGYQRWTVDLGQFAGRTAEVSITTIGAGYHEYPGVAVDDIVSSTGEGTTSFEADADPGDGWRAALGPRGNFEGRRTWLVGGTGIAPASLGERAKAVLHRQPAMIAFLAGKFGPYPFSSAGGTVVDVEVGYAMETQTRPTYPITRFANPVEGEDVVVHEIAHQWFGNSVTPRRWRYLWLNEGFARYAEWLWSAERGRETAGEMFSLAYERYPPGHSFWRVKIGTPSAKDLFTGALYDRGAMTLHQLRRTVGDATFFAILRQWATGRAGGHGTTAQFVALAEALSGKDLDAFFDRWLMTGSRPKVTGG